MTTKTKAETETVSIEQAFTELQEARDGVSEAQEALTTAQAEQTAKVEQIKSLIDDLKAKAKELGLEIAANVEEAQEAVSQKLDEAKDEWATEAAENPNDARRKIRLIWAVIGAEAGFVLGAAAGYLFAVL